MDDRLKQIWDRQYDFNKNFFNFKGTHINDLSQNQSKDFTKEFVLHLIYETNEILANFNWKMHRVQDEKVIVSNIAEEIIDVFKYLLGICNIWGISDEEFFEEFLRKSSVVEQRFKQEHELDLLRTSENVIAIDIDGVLADYPDYFIEWYNLDHGTRYEDLHNMRRNIGVDKYEDAKDEYRQSGVKRWMWPMPDASSFTKKIKELGLDIVLLSSRPYKTYSRIFADTLYWLNNNDIKYDTILWDEEKDLKLVKMIPKVKVVIEDDIKYADDISQLDVPVILLNSTYNTGFGNEKIIRVNDLIEAYEQIEKIVNDSID